MAAAWKVVTTDNYFSGHIEQTKVATPPSSRMFGPKLKQKLSSIH